MPDEELEASEFQARFAAAMENLPARRREVFELVRFQGLTYQEVAEVLEVSHQTVANQMTLAHRDLRRMLAGFLTESAVGRDLGNSGSQDG
jgi:RNA polymerase sigma-70 factor (ECF subfamily)